ncbi:hypothetical protein [Merismopedia glauca]|nr:hypothetical protein [Merismopedia glauca]
MKKRNAAQRSPNWVEQLSLDWWSVIVAILMLGLVFFGVIPPVPW